MSMSLFDFGDSVTNDDEVEHKGAYFLLHSNLKIFSKALIALSKLGSDLYLEPSVHGLSLKAFNTNKSAYGVFLFSNDFFSDVDYSELTENTNNIRRCRISIKCATSIFKGIQFLDKNFMSFKMWIDPEGDTLVVEILHAYDLSKKLEIHVMENGPASKTTVDKNKLANVTIASSDILMASLTLMRSTSEELVITSKDEEFIFKNYCSEGNYDYTDKIVKTEAKIQLDDLMRHEIAHETEITIPLKDFMAILTFASNHQSPVSLYYDHPGRPLIVALEGDVSYTSEFFIKTSKNAYSEADESGQIEVRTVSSKGSRSQKSETVQQKVSSQSQIRSAQPQENKPPSKNEPTSSTYQAPQPITTAEPPSRNASFENPYLTPPDSNILHSTNAAQLPQEPVADAEFVDDVEPLQPNTLLENLGFDFNAGTQRLDPDIYEEKLIRSPSPKRSKNTEFRRYFLNFDQATQRLSQANQDESILAYDSFDEDSS